MSEDNWSNPTVSICCITFNHKQYIADAIEGFLMQKTEFSLEILVHDDASTDGTSDIIRQYHDDHPNLIRAIIQTENQYSQGKKPSQILFGMARGKYIALCEGDDYWTDPLKLQKQVDFLESHPECSMCFNRTYIFHQGSKVFIGHSKRHESIYCPIEEIILHNSGIHTCSVLFRSVFLDEIPKIGAKFSVGDTPLFILLGLQGKIGYLDDVMSVYRIHKGGVWQSANPEDKSSICINVFEQFKDSFGAKYKNIIDLLLSIEYLNQAQFSIEQGNIKNSKDYFHKSLKTSRNNPKLWDDLFVMFFRLYLPIFYKVGLMIKNTL
jgi:glycosyltransferase involved in cell wall biosynthesis